MRSFLTLATLLAVVSVATAQGSVSGTFQGRYAPDIQTSYTSPQSAVPVQYTPEAAQGCEVSASASVTRVGPLRRWLNKRRAGRIAMQNYAETNAPTVSYAPSACNPTVSYSVGASNTSCPCTCANCTCPGHGVRFGQPYTITRCGPNGCVSTTYSPMPH